MAKTVALGGRITRRYVQLKLNRDRRRLNGDSMIVDYIDSLKKWLTAQPKRTARPGGIGRKLTTPTAVKAKRARG